MTLTLRWLHFKATVVLASVVLYVGVLVDDMEVVSVRFHLRLLYVLHEVLNQALQKIENATNKLGLRLSQLTCLLGLSNGYCMALYIRTAT